MSNENEIPAADTAARRAIILKYWQSERSFYNKARRLSLLSFSCLQILTIVFGSLTPILLLVDNKSFPRWVAALPGVLATITAAINISFRPREEWARQAATVNALDGERVRFDSRTGKYYSTKLTEDEALDNFSNRISDIVNGEVSDWRSNIQEQTRKGRASTKTSAL